MNDKLIFFFAYGVGIFTGFQFGQAWEMWKAYKKTLIK